MQPAPRPVRILLVDDDRAIRRLMARFLRDQLEALDIGEAADAEVALLMVAEEPWDVILLDISLPGKSGLEALRELRARGDRVPVVIVSGAPEVPYRAAALAAGANAFVPKERAAEELRAAVWSLVPEHLRPVSGSEDALGDLFSADSAGVPPPPAELGVGDARSSGRILVIDDEPLILKMFTRILPDHQVAGAADGEAALTAIRAAVERGENYDVIFCDLMMPGLTGMEVHTRLAAVDPLMAERMVFLSGGAFTPESRAFMASVDNVWIDKPISAKALDQLVRDRVASVQSTFRGADERCGE